ncbi:hypothetical protein [Arthrobacter sp. H5]|uniref:hypothetical protein n=1 Tax=Arthrobacter sp. H5 TaxID=1267973 RepID=UPI000483BAC1|nr:hypothetical protein [Arthrobacter sp. H5]
MTTGQPVVPIGYEPTKFVCQFAKHELQWLAEHHMRKAQEAHQDARKWMNRALLAEARLALYDAREKANK